MDIQSQNVPPVAPPPVQPAPIQAAPLAEDTMTKLVRETGQVASAVGMVAGLIATVKGIFGIK